MSVNGVTNNTAGTYTYQSQNKNEEKKAEKTDAKNETGVIYEPSGEEAAVAKPKKYQPDEATISRLLAENEARTNQFLEMVRQMISQQGQAVGKGDSIWSLLREGKLTPDEATRDQAIKDISEDGYWGVKQTSQRILDFAKALTGGDPSKIDEMERAFEKGFKMAEKTWGGKLPQLCQDTFGAVRDGFAQMREEAGLA